MNEKQASPEAIFKMKKEKFIKKFASASLKAWPSFEKFFLGKNGPEKNRKKKPGRQRLKKKKIIEKQRKKRKKKIRKKKVRID